jgi:hypothetical protein
VELAESEDEVVTAPAVGRAVGTAALGRAVNRAIAKDPPPAAIGNAAPADGDLQLVLAQPKACASNVGKFPEAEVQCALCGSMCALSKVRVFKKSNGTWKCLRCGVTVTTCYKQFGGVPAELGEISKERLQDFYKKAHDIHLRLDLPGLVQQFSICKQKTDEKFYANQGEFLPLKVWKTRGFSARSIREGCKPEDKRVCPVLGEVYRVAIMSSGSQGLETTTTTNEVEILPRERPLKRKRQVSPEPEVKAALTLVELKAQLDDAKKKQQSESKVEKKNAKTIATLQQTTEKISEMMTQHGSVVTAAAVQSAKAVIERVKVLAVSKDDISEDSNLDSSMEGNFK